MNQYIAVLKKYAVFEGRARRSEYWIFCLVNWVVTTALGIADSKLGLGATLSIIYSLAILLPTLAVWARRLHDIGRTGWWLLIALIPCIGWIVLLIFNLQDSQPGHNQYGPNPKE